MNYETSLGEDQYADIKREKRYGTGKMFMLDTATGDWYYKLAEREYRWFASAEGMRRLIESLKAERKEIKKYLGR